MHWIRGNCERELLEGSEHPLVSRTPPLDRESHDLVSCLPLTLTLDVDGLGPTLFCHATPTSDEKILTRATPTDIVTAAVGEGEARTVVCGHTHTQYDRRAGEVRVVNAGSVGMAYEEEPGAYWLLLGPDVEHRRTEYDVDAFAASAAEAGFAELPRATPAEAIAYFEGVAAERGER